MLQSPCRVRGEQSHSRRRASAGVKFSPESVRTYMRKRAKTLGLNLPSPRLMSGEAARCGPPCPRPARRTIPDARRAAEACQAELSRLPRRAAKPHVRTLVAVHRRIHERCYRAGRIGSHTNWRPDEDAVLRRFARALVHGRYSSILAAAGPCRDELIRKTRAFADGKPVLLLPFVGAVRSRVLEPLTSWSAEACGVEP